MHLNIYDQRFTRIAAVYTWVSLLWKPTYNSGGTFQVELQLTDGILQLFSPGRFVMYSEDDEETVMLIVSAQEYGKKVIVNGFSADWMLTKRVSNTKVEKENAEKAIKKLFEEMTPLTNLSYGETKGFEDVFKAQKKGGDIHSYVKTICRETDTGFRARKSGKQLIFELYKPQAGEKPNLRFSERFGNMGDKSYTVSDINAANVALVVSGNRSVWVGNIEATGYERKEIFVSSSSTDTEEMKTEGAEKLVECAKIEEVRFALLDDDAKLGDIVPVRLDSQNITVTARITSKEIKNQNNITTKTIGVGEPISIKRRS